MSNPSSAKNCERVYMMTSFPFKKHHQSPACLSSIKSPKSPLVISMMFSYLASADLLALIRNTISVIPTPTERPTRKNAAPTMINNMLEERALVLDWSLKLCASNIEFSCPNRISSSTLSTSNTKSTVFWCEEKLSSEISDRRIAWSPSMTSTFQSKS